MPEAGPRWPLPPRWGHRPRLEVDRSRALISQRRRRQPRHPAGGWAAPRISTTLGTTSAAPPRDRCHRLRVSSRHHHQLSHSGTLMAIPRFHSITLDRRSPPDTHSQHRQRSHLAQGGGHGQPSGGPYFLTDNLASHQSPPRWPSPPAGISSSSQPAPAGSTGARNGDGGSAA